MGAIAATFSFSTVVPSQAALNFEAGASPQHIEPARLIEMSRGEKRYHLNIAAQPLLSALEALHARTRLQFLFATEALATVRSAAVVGEFTAKEALAKLLEGSGVSQRFTGEGTASLRVAQEGGVTELEGIVVTGEKIDRPYLDTFTSVGVATNEDIKNYHLDDLGDTFNQMANVRSFSSNRGNNGFQIRGVNADGVTQPANSAPLISVIIDGATQNVEGTKRGARGTWDVKQVEVLRGPQSTLYGRTALAGAVVIETNDPTYTPEMEAKGVIGDQERRDGAFMISGPIIDNQVAFRIAGEWRDQVKDITFADPANEELGEDTYRNLRGKILIEPKDVAGLSALLTFSHTFDNPSANAVTGPDFFARRFDGTSIGTEFREVTSNNYISNVAYGLADGYKIRSLSSYIDTDLELSSPPSTASLFSRDDLRDGEDFTQDLRLEIDDKARGLSGVIGLFYGSFNTDTDTSILADAGIIGGGAPIGVIVPLQVGTFTNETETKAIYADMRYKFYGGWSVIGGARYQMDTVHNTADTVGFLGNSFDLEAEFNVILPKYGLAYDIDDTQTVALTATRGYRQGFSEVLLSPGGGVNEVAPEFVWTYELAYRKTTADKRLTYGVNVFYNKYTDQQITITDPILDPLANTFNAGESESYGAEIEARYDFGNGLTVFGAVGLLKTEFKDFDDAACIGGTCTGNEFPEAPNLTFSFGGTYKHASGFFASASANYTGDYYTASDVNNLSVFEIENRFLVNAKIGYEYESMTISAFADNIFDEQYLTGISTTSDEAYIGDGRVVGVELRAKF
jgi:iron complex outermembrane receptor protein